MSRTGARLHRLRRSDLGATIVLLETIAISPSRPSFQQGPPPLDTTGPAARRERYESLFVRQGRQGRIETSNHSASAGPLLGRTVGSDVGDRRRAIHRRPTTHIPALIPGNFQNPGSKRTSRRVKCLQVLKSRHKDFLGQVFPFGISTAAAHGSSHRLRTGAFRPATERRRGPPLMTRSIAVSSCCMNSAARQLSLFNYHYTSWPGKVP